MYLENPQPKLPDGSSNGNRAKKSYDRLAPGFRKLVDTYANVAVKRGNQESSIYGVSSEASAFFLVLQELGFRRIEDVTEDAVLSAFTSPDGRKLRGYNCRKAVTTVIKACIPLEPDAYTRLLSLIPNIRCTRNNIQYLTEFEVKKIREALDDAANPLTLRDRAIGKLALHTGLRCSDIANMDLTSIDWEHDRIRIKQQKTKVPIELPLNAVVGNAVYDYLANERPLIGIPALFISQKAPLRRLKAVSVCCISARLMKIAGIRQSKGDRKGLHIFRHRVATNLMGNNVSQAVTSRVLGHLSPLSAESYLSADFMHLKSCALSISGFPVAEEVFCHE